MSVEAISWALGADVGSATRKLVLIGYANHAHKDGTQAFPAKATIAEYANCDLRTVIRHVNKLIVDGWIRVGDQQLVDHLRGDRRPVVYDLAMNEETRLAWKVRGDSLSPRDNDADSSRGGDLAPRENGVHGVHGVTKPAPRGDTAVSPEPSTNQPPIAPTRCPRHASLVANCRACGTTPRQLEEQRQRLEAARRREADQAAAAAERSAREHRDPADPDLIDRTKAIAAAARIGSGV